MADLADVARGLESGLRSYLSFEDREDRKERQEAAERRRRARERRRRQEHEASMRNRRNERTLQEARAAERGVELEGVEQTDPGGPQAYGPGGRELNVTDVPRSGMRARNRDDLRRQESPVPILTGDETLMGEDQQLEGMATGRPELETRRPTSPDTTALQDAFSEEMARAAQAPPGADPDVEAGAIDPQTGTFAQGPVFRPTGGGQPDIGSVLTEGEVRRERPSYRLSGGQQFTPGAAEARALDREIERIMDARPDLSREQAELLARDQEDVLTFDRPEELDDTFNIAGRETRDIGQAADWRRELYPSRYGSGPGGEDLSQSQLLARQYGFDNMADFRRFQDRTEGLREVYGNTQGDPVLQKALEARAMGMSESEVLNRVTNQAREKGYSGREIEQLRQDVRGFFAQRTRQQIERLQSGDLSGPNYGSGFDLEFSAPSDSAAGGGGGSGGGVGPLRNRGGGR